MTFVFEKIPPEERHKLKGIRGPTNQQVYDDVTVRHWTIDRERDALLVKTAGGINVEIPYCYALSWKGKTVEFWANETDLGSRRRPEGKDVYRKVFNFVLPDYFADQRQEVLQLAKEAFDVYGFNGHSENVRVHLEFYNSRTGTTPWI